MASTNGKCRVGNWMVLFALLAAVAGCSSSPRVETDYALEHDFQGGGGGGYAWLDMETPRGDPRYDNDLLARRIKDAWGRFTAGTSLRAVDRAQARYLVNYHVVVDDVVELDRFYSAHGFHPWYYPHPWGWYDRDLSVRHYEEGTLILDLIDAQSKALVWRGSASARVDRTLTPVERQQRIDRLVSAIVAHLPEPIRPVIAQP